MPNPSRNKGSKNIVEWRVIPSFSDYEVSEFGSVRRREATTNGIPARYVLSLSPWGPVGSQGDRYLSVSLSVSGKAILRCAHRLVAEAFLGIAPFPRAHVAHIDGTRSNNHFTNLRWSTHKENMRDAAHLGVHKGERNGRAKLSTQQVREIRSKYSGKYGQLSALAREYGTVPSNIQFIVKGAHWSHAE